MSQSSPLPQFVQDSKNALDRAVAKLRTHAAINGIALVTREGNQTVTKVPNLDAADKIAEPQTPYKTSQARPSNSDS